MRAYDTSYVPTTTYFTLTPTTSVAVTPDLLKADSRQLVTRQSDKAVLRQPAAHVNSFASVGGTLLAYQSC